mmetsp:Transcript_3857/g.5923  ORF Transcript_3857/g.5923 Transcript_3857/m.5923 type:complete len:397 (-) Transcript_3857:902-2092(-)
MIISRSYQSIVFLFASRFSVVSAFTLSSTAHGNSFRSSSLLNLFGSSRFQKKDKQLDNQMETAAAVTTSSTSIAQTTQNNMAQLDLTSIQKFAHKNGDALFGYIEECQMDDPLNKGSFGRFLDAGTGSHSLRWMASILHREHLLATTGNGSLSSPNVSMESYTAITADETMRRRVFNEAKELGIAEKGDVIIGNWKEGVGKDGTIEFGASKTDNGSKLLLEGQQFDTILADYLVGAIDGFSPYFQDLIFNRLVPHLAPGGRLYVIGLQPIPDSVDSPANIMCKIRRVRDACILLANHRCYREYPLEWIERHLRKAGLNVVQSRTYPIRYDHSTMVRQINVGRSKLKLFPTKAMAAEMGKVLDDLEKECLEVTRKQPGRRITLGYDYVVVAERPVDD